MRKPLGYEIKTLSRMIKQCIDDTEFMRTNEQMTGMQGWVLGYFTRHERDDIFQKDLEAEFFVRGSTMAEALNQLETAGYIERRTSDEDRRLKIVRPTLKATEAYAGMEDHIRTMEESLTRGVDPRDLAVYFEVVDKICNNLEAE